MSEETFEVRHEPKTVFQVESCVSPGGHHALHRRFTGLAHYTCNCGYSSGWVPRGTLPPPTDFIRDHLPAGVVWPWPDEVGA